MLIQGLQPYDSSFRESVHHLLVGTITPVTWALESVGVVGEPSPGLLALVLGSICLYLAGVGFVVAAGLRKLWKLI